MIPQNLIIWTLLVDGADAIPAAPALATMSLQRVEGWRRRRGWRDNATLAEALGDDPVGRIADESLGDDIGNRHQVARVMLVGVVALSSVNVIAVVEPSSFFTVMVVALIDFSCWNCCSAMRI